MIFEFCFKKINTEKNIENNVAELKTNEDFRIWKKKKEILKNENLKKTCLDFPKPIGLLKNSQQNDNRIKSPVSPPLIGRLKSHWVANGMIRNRASITPGRRNSDTNTATTHALRIFKVI